MSIAHELLGGWVIIHAVNGGRPEADYHDDYYWFEHDQVVLGDPASFGICRYDADPTSSPSKFDIWGSSDDPFHQSAIYKFVDHQLVISCVDGEQQQRPTGFESTSDNGWVVYKLDRTSVPVPA